MLYLFIRRYLKLGISVFTKLFGMGDFEFNVVGGTIRDLILGVESDDFDICTDALPKEILETVKDVIADLEQALS